MGGVVGGVVEGDSKTTVFFYSESSIIPSHVIEYPLHPSPSPSFLPACAAVYGLISASADSKHFVSAPSLVVASARGVVASHPGLILAEADKGLCAPRPT